jgi:hypothetical protein
LCVQGRIVGAIKQLRSCSISKKLPEKDRRIAKQISKRFLTAEPDFRRLPRDAFIQRLISLYRIYWHQVLLSPTSQVGAENNLKMRLIELAGPFTSNISFGEIETELEKRLLKKGYYSILGKVLPYRELEIWKNQIVIKKTIELPETTVTFKVVEMEGFICKGWMDYATCGHTYPGGWAKKHAIYCNRSRYRKRTNEAFLVSFLAHEAQHFADYKKFPKLAQTGLEYRAKLTEITLAKRSLRTLIRKFESNVSRSRKSPHAFANYKLISQLRRELRIPKSEQAISDQIPASVIRSIAKNLLFSHTRELKKIE